ncbi:hypothetical protein MVEN_01084100 [Mycena venus]|uniref:DUF6534 domain-containing protein n=1 Tax=Mycena venus TaxID=2733690 RepID=A0A8H6Y8T2_9AGAR|nr:hypothetical protein MVEN_01084100 [Mycena venus]
MATSCFSAAPKSRPISSSCTLYSSPDYRISSHHLQNSAALFWCLAQCYALRCLHCAGPFLFSPLQKFLSYSDAWIRYLIYYLILMETINTICDIGVIYEPLIILHGATSLPQFLLYCVERDTGLQGLRHPNFLVVILAAGVLVIRLHGSAPRFRQISTIASPDPNIDADSPLHGVAHQTGNEIQGAGRAGGLLIFTSLAATLLFSPARPLGPKLPEIITALAVWLTSTAFADLFITGFLVNSLWANKTVIQTQTDSVTDKIIFFTVQTGVLTSFAAVADVLLFLIAPAYHSSSNFIWDFSLSKILNARTEWNILLAAGPSAEEKISLNAIIRVREATDIEGLQLYVPSQLESSANPSPCKRTSHAGWAPGPLPQVPTQGFSRGGS